MLRAVAQRAVGLQGWCGASVRAGAIQARGAVTEITHHYDKEHVLLTEQQQSEFQERIREAEVEGHPIPCKKPEKLFGIFSEETMADTIVRETLEARQAADAELCQPRKKPLLCREIHVHDVCCGGDEADDQWEPHSESG